MGIKGAEVWVVLPVLFHGDRKAVADGGWVLTRMSDIPSNCGSKA